MTRGLVIFQGCFATLAATFSLAAIFGVACAPAGGNGSPDNAGSLCEGPADCYPDIDHAELRGEVVCTEKADGGYCTHLCEADNDCCAIPGECVSDVRQVCSPFENDDTKRCFLSCELEDIGDYDDPDLYCNDFWARGWTCASSGGGGENRKICKP